ncbi:DUF4240 domain-containing protein [Paeniglutamicibacter kerguelensis]|uniref:DUF4240 domain-containing protein n=2 Tax=Paeniglutamicibacter kerguelensis TaxID=254788 RepID=A0ABS4XB55_9MICC|nr:hypothetical protein [Paeniglutamicibacter kerguelensis]
MLLLASLSLVLGACGVQPSVEGAAPHPVEPTTVPQPAAEVEPELRYMKNGKFWDIIDRSLEASGGSTGRQAVELEEILAAMPPEQIASFNATFVSKNLELYTWELWGAAYVLVGGCLDDCFEYFRNWVVGQGSDYHQAVKRDPQVLADGRLRSDVEIGDAESLAYTGADAYLRSSGGRELYEDYPESPSTIAGEEPWGTAWDEEEVENLYPGLTPLPAD